MFVVSAVCCQVEVSATSWSLVQRSPTDCGASLCVCDLENLKNEEAMTRVGSQRHKKTVESKLNILYVIRDPVGNNNNSIANCIFYVTKKVINLKMAHN